MPAKTARARRSQTPKIDLAAIQAAYDKGAHRKALYRAKTALRHLPDDAALNALAGSSAHALGLLDEAEGFYRRAVTLDGTGSAWQRGLGEVLMALDQPDDAIACYAARLDANTEDAGACDGLGRALLATGQHQKAMTILSEAVRLCPENAQYLVNLGQAFESSGMIEQAGQCFALACRVAPDNPWYHTLKARAAHYIGDSRQALDTLHMAQVRWPRNAELLNAEAVILSAMGQREDARAKYRAAIRAEPENHVPFANFANNFSMTDEGMVEDAVRRMLRAPGGSRLRRRSLSFTMAKIHEDKGDLEQAYEMLVRANQLRKAELRYDIEQDMRLFRTLKRQFDGVPAPERVQAAQGPIPIFIVGLPRSGTTLIETILSRHRDLTALGELDSLMHAVRRSLPDGASSDWAEALCRDYMSSLPTAASDASGFTDKMPLNFRFVGHIATAMPEARIVHVTRDARATCWSIFRHFFSSAGNGFAYDPEDLVQFFHLYRDLMEFWQTRFPSRIIGLDYDALTADPEGETRLLVDRLGLDWDVKCLSPEKAGRAVLTASSQQVRRKVYGGSSEAWRRYEPYAGGWLNRLAQVP